MKINFGKNTIGSGTTFIIAEIGNNHNGSITRAKEMVDIAHETGVDCVKFQMRNLSEVYRKRALDNKGEDLGTEYILDLLNRFELTIDEHREIAEYCKSKNIFYLCTPWDSSSIDILETFGVPGYKVASADLTNMPLLEKLVSVKKPLILSTGMSKSDEIDFTVSFLNARKAEFVLLHCNSTYPAPIHDINLNFLHNLKELHPLVGYSGHERGINVSLAAVALGASVVERHFTLDRDMEGPDHAASLTSDEFKKLVSGIREIESALGEQGERKVSQGELINRENLAKSMVAAKPITAGTKIKSEHIKICSPGQGLSPQFYEKLVGVAIHRDMDEEDFFYLSDIEQISKKPGKYTFSRPWGVPVRYHDFAFYDSIIKPDVFEFHLSYSDMNLDIDKFLSGIYDSDFVVHAPELFKDSELMDLASPDDNYRAKSIRETQSVIDITRELKSYFPRTKTPLIVANVGGFSMDEPLPADLIPSYYERFANSLEELDMEGVEIIPQTMAPFPWHFGGQRHQNIFVHADEIIKWCKILDLRVCFDVSHTSLVCNHFNYDFYEFAEKIAPYSAHIHVGDAKGVNGEGLQIGDGDINFKRLGDILKTGCPNASFIPEIWQGHKNEGEGFWVSLDKLNGLI